jgi:hypothetical protein
LFKQLLIVVPTRNRGELAVRSALSALQCDDPASVSVMISDNSTEAEQSAQLRAFVAAQARAELRLVAPPAPLPMTAHWEWAINTALESSAASHFLFLTDRMSFRAGQLRELIEILRRYPDEVLSYTLDRIDDFARPVRYRPLPRTGMLFRMPSARLLAASAQMGFPSCLPRMLNCAVPRAHLLRSQARFGGIFASVAPDFCFCYRCLDLNESILYYDKSVLLNYALDRSNGASLNRGVQTRDSRDFLASLGAGGLNALAPVPEVVTVGNAIVHEYNFVRRQSHSGAFPPLDREKYLDHLAGEVSDYLDRGLRREALAHLRSQGWRPGWRFHRNRLLARATMLAVRLREHRFGTTAAALDYANGHWPADFRFKAMLARRYGSDSLPLPEA